MPGPTPATSILLHGFACQPRMWADVALRLKAAGVSVVTPTLPGHGHRGTAGASATFADVAANLTVEVLTRSSAVGTDAAPHLVGYSLGGRIALAMALAAPEKFATVTLVSAGTGIADEAEREERRRWDSEQGRLLEAMPLAAFMDRWEKLPIFATQARLAAEVLAEQRRQRLEHDSAGLAWAMRVLGQGNMPALGARLAACRGAGEGIPTLLLTGAEDLRYSANAAALARRFGAARHVSLAAAGHNVVLEQPGSVAQALLEFWRAREADRRGRLGPPSGA